MFNILYCQGHFAFSEPTSTWGTKVVRAKDLQSGPPLSGVVGDKTFTTFV
jgi:hypothetical protein